MCDPLSPPYFLMWDLKLSCVIGPYVADFPQQNSSVSAINSNTSSNEVRRVIAEKIPLLQTQTTAPPSLPSLVCPLFSRRPFLFPSKIPEKTFTRAGGPGRGVWNIYEPPDRGSWILDCCPCCHLAARAGAAASEPSRDRGFKRPLGSPRDGEAALWSGHSGEERIVHWKMSCANAQSSLILFYSKCAGDLVKEKTQLFIKQGL